MVWRVWDEAIDGFVLNEGRYERFPADEQGVYRSPCFPGLWLDAPAALSGDFPRVLAVLQTGLASPEHQAFAAGT